MSFGMIDRPMFNGICRSERILHHHPDFNSKFGQPGCVDVEASNRIVMMYVNPRNSELWQKDMTTTFDAEAFVENFRAKGSAAFRSPK